MALLPLGSHHQRCQVPGAFVPSTQTVLLISVQAVLTLAVHSMWLTVRQLQHYTFAAEQPVQVHRVPQPPDSASNPDPLSPRLHRHEDSDTSTPERPQTPFWRVRARMREHSPGSPRPEQSGDAAPVPAEACFVHPYLVSALPPVHASSELPAKSPRPRPDSPGQHHVGLSSVRGGAVLGVADASAGQQRSRSTPGKHTTGVRITGATEPAEPATIRRNGRTQQAVHVQLLAPLPLRPKSAPAPKLKPKSANRGHSDAFHSALQQLAQHTEADVAAMYAAVDAFLDRYVDRALDLQPKQLQATLYVLQAFPDDVQVCDFNFVVAALYRCNRTI